MAAHAGTGEAWVTVRPLAGPGGARPPRPVRPGVQVRMREPAGFDPARLGPARLGVRMPITERWPTAVARRRCARAR